MVNVMLIGRIPKVIHTERKIWGIIEKGISLNVVERYIAEELIEKTDKLEVRSLTEYTK